MASSARLAPRILRSDPVHDVLVVLDFAFLRELEKDAVLEQNPALFHHLGLEVADDVVALRGKIFHIGIRLLHQLDDNRLPAGVDGTGNRADRLVEHVAEQTDRKSTRLNSSHLVISYA